MRVLTALAALLSHWRRSLGQLATLIIGLSLATGLWTGVQAINTEARTSYAKAAEQVSPAGTKRIRASNGGSLTIAQFVKLQRAGWRTSPVLEGELRLKTGVVSITGFDPLTAPPELATRAFVSRQSDRQQFDIGDFLGNPGRLLTAKGTAKRLEGNAGLPPVIIVEGLPSNLILTDIGTAERLLGKPGKISHLLVAKDQTPVRAALEDIGPELVEEQVQSTSEISRLTDSFHLNLLAFGFLSFAVGLFIVHGTIGLAFEQRRALFRTLRVMGLSARDLIVALCLELFGFALVAGALGVALGYFIAAALLPDVAATLRGLYGAEVAGGLEFRPEWWGAGLAVAILGTAAASASSLWRLMTLSVLASAQPRAWALMSRRSLTLQLAAAVGFFAMGLAMWLFGSGLVFGFAILGALLLGAALALPPMFARVLTFCERFARGPVSQWFWADTRQQVPGLSLALMALLLALAANIGVSTMVGSFRTTFTGWLEQRLAAELYVRADNQKKADEIKAWLEPQVDAMLPVWSTKAKILDRQGEIFGVSDHETYRKNWPLLDSLPDVWDRVAAGKGLLINEQLSRRKGLSVGDDLKLADRPPQQIAGIYSDYGNPAPQIMVAVPTLLEWYPDVPRRRYAVRVLPEKVPGLIGQLKSRFGLNNEQVVDQASIKAFSVGVFERTFAITDALNVLTLAVAGFAIFTSLLTLASMRLPQLAPVWALGLTRKRLASLDLLRTVLLAALTAVFALPIGLVLAWLLLTVVNVEAFGWRLPMHLFVGDWVKLGLLALLAACLAAAVPARRLAKTDPATLVKVFSHER